MWRTFILEQNLVLKSRYSRGMSVRFFDIFVDSSTKCQTIINVAYNNFVENRWKVSVIVYKNLNNIYTLFHLLLGIFEIQVISDANNKYFV